VANFRKLQATRSLIGSVSYLESKRRVYSCNSPQNLAHIVPGGEALPKVDAMGANDRVETGRCLCDCGKGQFVFYSCEAERWLYVDNPLEKWFEMHISCEHCANKLQKYRPTALSIDEEVEGWKIIIPEPNRIPIH
jgi:hypothetical protein